jgi:hypothetical protein
METSASASPDIERPRAWVVPCLTILVVAIALAYFWHMRSQPFDTDSPYYIKIAEGRIAEVKKPFTARLLQPAIAGCISRATGLSLDTSFLITNTACLAALVAASLSLMLRYVRSIALALAIVLCPMTLGLFRDIYMPDCMHAALVAVFFWVLARREWWWAVPLLFFMQVTRDSTVLLTFVLVLVAAYDRKWLMACASVVVTALGIGVVSHFSSAGQSNIHESNTLVYLVGKVPFNFFTNVCGIRLWTITHAKNNPNLFPNEPIVKFDVPQWVPVGAMRQVGIYSLDATFPLMTFRILTTIFGVMPSIAILFIVWRRFRLAREDGISFVGRVALVYGIAAFFLGPSIGASVGRLVAYGWPMAWIAVPMLLGRYFGPNQPFYGRLASLQAVACWPPLVLKAFGLGNVATDLIALAVAVICHVIAITLLRRECRTAVAATPAR